MKRPEIIAEHDDALPMLAWVARVTSDNIVHLRHGRAVEICERFFVEGVWEGDFATGDLLASHALFGTGGGVSEDAVWFASPMPLSDWMYEAKRDDVVTVSNSLPLLLAAIDDRLDPRADCYGRINASLLNGIFEYDDVLPTLKGHVRRHVHRNLTVRGGEVEVSDKKLPPKFTTFAQYRDLLFTTAARLAENARSPARREKMAIFSTQSRGYDSTCCNAVFAPQNIDAVFTIREGKGLDGYVDSDKKTETNDDGTDIARALGLHVVPIERRAFEKSVEHELLFWAGIHDNRDLNFVGIHQALRAHAGPCRPAMIVNGLLGDVVWTPSDVFLRFEPNGGQTDRPTDGNLRRGDLSHYGLTEVRLQVGYVQVPVPFIGARWLPDLIGISDSDEMRPWRCVPNYDRPVARRIAEEAGVPRGMFGQVKMGSVVEFAPPVFPVNPELRREVEDFIVRNRLASRPVIWCMKLVHRFNTMREFVSPRFNPINYYVMRLYQRLTGRSGKIPQIMTHLNDVTYRYAVNKVAEHYARSLSQ